MSLFNIPTLVVFVVSSLTIATPMAISASTAPYRTLSRLLANYKCYEIEIQPNLAEKLLVCTNNKYYLSNQSQNSVKELRDLKTQGNNQVVAETLRGEQKTLTVTETGLKSFRENLSLRLSKSRQFNLVSTTRENIYCFLGNSASDTSQSKFGIFCSWTVVNGLDKGVIELTEFK